MLNPKQRMDELKARFPYQFAGPNIGISVYAGWLPLFETLCFEIDLLLAEDKNAFKWVQCKEKLGSARFYYVFDHLSIISEQNEVKKRSLDRLVETAELKTERLCYICGEPGRLDNSQGWALTLCENHKLMRANNNDAFYAELNQEF